MPQGLPHKVVIFANTFTLAGVEGTFAPGVYVVEAMEARLAKAGAHNPDSLMAIMLPASNLSAPRQRVEIEASELEAALAKDREAGETKS